MDAGLEASIRLAVHVAETGQYFELNCPVSTPVHALQTCIGSNVHVDPREQLLLCDHLSLEAHKTLASYRFPYEKWDVFLFNRSRLLADSSLPSMERTPVKDLALPLPPSRPICFVTWEFRHHASAREIKSFERHFSYHFQKGNAFFVCIRDKFETCKRLFREQQVQVLAMDAAKRNMNHLFEMIRQSVTEFTKRFEAQQKNHTEVLEDLDEYLERLRSCNLHPSFASEKHNSLVDCVDEASLRKQVAECTTYHKRLQIQVLQTESSYTELNSSIEDLLRVPPIVDIFCLEQLLSENAHMMEEQQIVLQSLRKDVNTARSVVNASFLPEATTSALVPMYDMHEKNQLPKIEACHQKLEKLLENFATRKHEMSVGLHIFMQKVAVLQCKIRDIRNQFSTCDEAMKHQDELFSDLTLACKVGTVYRACLAELVRRKASMKLYMGQADQLAELMAKKRADEVARRDAFLHDYSAILPHDLLVSMGLFSTPSQCIINVEPYDTKLLDLHIEDLEKFAPEALCGPYFKASVTGSPHLSHEFRVSGSEECSEALLSIETLDEISTEITGTTKLEVENAWLKSEYASAIALLCSIDTNLVSLTLRNGNDFDATKKTMEALALKDDHSKQLRRMVSASQLQCGTYARRIQELEQRLSERYNALPQRVSESCTPGPDEAEFSVMNDDMKILEKNDSLKLIESSSEKNSVWDVESNEVEQRLGGIGNDMVEMRHATRESQQEDLESGHMVLATMSEKGLKAALKELGILKEELEKKTVLLNECYINCASLESNLLSAREEAWTHKCLASRKTAEYSSLRTSTVKLRGLVERLRQCVLSTQTDLPHSLQLFAKSLDGDDEKDEVMEEFSGCLYILSERMVQLVQKDSTFVQSSGCIINDVSPVNLTTTINLLKIA